MSFTTRGGFTSRYIHKPASGEKGSSGLEKWKIFQIKHNPILYSTKAEVPTKPKKPVFTMTKLGKSLNPVFQTSSSQNEDSASNLASLFFDSKI